MRDELLTLPQVAARLSCSVATVKRRIRSGALPAYRDGRLVRVRELDLDRYIAAHVRRSAAISVPLSVPLVGVTLDRHARLWD